MKVMLRGDAEINADLVVDMNNAAGEGQITALHDTIALPTIRFSVAVIPIVIGSDVVLASKGDNQKMTPTKLKVGASAFAFAELGFTYSDALQLNERCYCVSDCLPDGLCWANQGCTEGGESEGWKTLECSRLSQSNDPGTVVANADWGFEYRPLTVLQGNADNIVPGRSTVNIGPLVTLWIYDYIPVELFTSV